ncbi:MAG: trypsin-like serine protease [Chloroflexi bacterium]|nr:trypsin-like serine protease [Chloroflexota bacterium]
MLTEGGQAPILQSLKPRAESLHKSARPWTMGEGIQGLGIGQKVTDAFVLPDLVLKVYVEKKLPKSKVTNMVPEAVDIPGIEEQLATDVEEIGKVELESNTSRVRSAIPGFSIGHLEISAGTLGCLVRVNGDDQGLYILSNSHVLANEGVAEKGDVIIQPGVFDDGVAPDDAIATLSDWVAFEFTDSTFPNLVDAAIAKVDSDQHVISAIRKIGIPKGVSKTVRRGMRIRKTGRTTDFTTGVITDIDYRLALDYKRPGGGEGRVGLRDQVLCTRYTAAGDSGSAVINSKGFIIGLHFAGSPSTSIFNKISNVIDLLDISIVTTEI